MEMDLASRETKVLQHANKIQIDPGYISEPQPIEFPTENGLTAHGFFYSPKNRDFQAALNEKPPLLVKSHGGPTSAAVGSLQRGIFYLTSSVIPLLWLDIYCVNQ